ncbi:hypothetical protein [Aliidiomarina celeris]|uniref:hypothetical protein n=1 Tax=Aliidiomarina celeris TaxID=2249428 RepID=UPI000DE8A9DD|nr:hypothetical protein [Aliidiomarina celeris]
MKRRVNKGFALISLIFVFLGVLAVMAVQLRVWVEADRKLRLEQWQFKSHELRMELFQLWLEKPAPLTDAQWRISAPVSAWINTQQQQGLTVRVEDSPVALIVVTHNENLAAELAPRLVLAQARAGDIYLPLPEQTPHDSSRWIEREGAEPAGMQTHLSMENNAIQTIDSVDAVTAAFQLLGAANGQAQHAESAHTSADALQTENLQAYNLTGAAASGTEWQSTQVHSQSLLGAKGDFSHVAATRIESESVASLNFITEQLTSEQVVVHQPVILSTANSDYFTETQQRLNTLDAQISHCIEVSQWCLAPQWPQVNAAQCIGCEQAQYQADFTATLQFDISDCLHGCSLHLTVEPSLPISCDRNEVPAHQSARVTCVVTATLAEGEERKVQVALRATSMKDTQFNTQRVMQLDWHRYLSRCESFSQMVPILDAVPYSEFRIEVPSAGVGETVTDLFHQNGCNMSRPTSVMSCSYSAHCNNEAQWQQVRMGCACS